MSFGAYPWLFLIPPVAIALIGVGAYLFSRTEVGKRRARFIRAKYGIVTGKEAESERQRLATKKDPEAEGGGAPEGAE